MKSKIIKILSLSIVILAVLTINSNASYNANNQTTTAGSDVTINLSSSQNVQNFNLELSDSGSLQYKSCNNASEAAVVNSSNGKIAYATAGNGTTNLGTYTFKAPEVTQTTTYQVKFNVDGETVISNVTVNPKNTNTDIDSSTNTKNQTITANTSTTTNNNTKQNSTENTTTTNNTTKQNSTENTATTNNTKQTTPEPIFTETNKTLYSSSDINVRSSYSTSSSLVGSLKKGDSVVVIGTSSNGWSKVKYNGQVAYIKSDLLTETKPVEETKSTNKALKSLDIEEGTLNPEFDKETTNYKLTVGKDVKSLKINAVAEDEKATVSISGNEKLESGENTVKVSVTAEDGTIRTYTISVTKQEKEKLKLSKLQITGVTLNETFSPDKYQYTVNLDENSNLTKLDIKVTANDEEANIEILGNDKLVAGENVITIMVKSKDGSENVTYQIVVNKAENTQSSATTYITQSGNNKTFLYVAIGIFSIALILIIIIIVRSIKKSKEDEYGEENNDDEENDVGFDYNSNYTEELYGIKMKKNTEEFKDLKQEKNTEKEIKELENTENNNINENKLYDIEKEVDFSDIDKPRKRKGGKHSK